MYLFIDTETTGWPLKGPRQQDGQGRVCQIAALLCDDKGNDIAKFKTLIKPDGWEISEGAQEVHGISLDLCEKKGIPQRVAIRVIYELMQVCDKVICHNIEFDWKMLEIEFDYAGMNDRINPDKEKFCTMLSSKDICKLPGKYGDYKWPKLSEALEIVCGIKIGDDAHDALVDVEACKKIFFKLMEGEK